MIPPSTNGQSVSAIIAAIASTVRGLTYVAAGWSLSSFQANDPLVADYIDYMLASPDVAEPVKTELKGLQTNPVFHGAAK